MKLEKYEKGVIHLSFEQKKDMTLTFFRIEEHYESRHPNIREQTFSIEDWLETFVEDDGSVDYLEGTYGFNIPADSIKRFYDRHAGQLTTRERRLKELLENTLHYDSDDFYVIATMAGDTRTIDHELSHAMFYFNPVYKEKATDLVNRMRPKQRKKFEKSLTEVGYAPEVFVDEIMAFTATSTRKYLEKEYEVKFTREEHKPFKKLFKEYIITMQD